MKYTIRYLDTKNIAAISLFFQFSCNTLFAGEEFDSLQPANIISLSQQIESLPDSIKLDHAFIDSNTGITFKNEFWSPEIDIASQKDNLFKSDSILTHNPLKRNRFDYIEQLYGKTLYFYAQDSSDTANFYSIILNPNESNSLYSGTESNIIFKPNIQFFLRQQTCLVFIKDENQSYCVAGSLKIGFNPNIDSEQISCSLHLLNNAEIDKNVLQMTLEAPQQYLLPTEAPEDKPMLDAPEEYQSFIENSLEEPWNPDSQTSSDSNLLPNNQKKLMVSNENVDTFLVLLDSNTVLGSMYGLNSTTKIILGDQDQTKKFIELCQFASCQFNLASLKQPLTSAIASRTRIHSVEKLNNKDLYIITKEDELTLKTVQFTNLSEEQKSSVLKINITKEENDLGINGNSQFYDKYMLNPYVYLKGENDQYHLVGVINNVNPNYEAERMDPVEYFVELGISWIDEDVNSIIDHEILKATLQNDQDGEEHILQTDSEPQKPYSLVKIEKASENQELAQGITYYLNWQGTAFKFEDSNIILHPIKDIDFIKTDDKKQLGDFFVNLQTTVKESGITLDAMNSEFPYNSNGKLYVFSKTSGLLEFKDFDLLNVWNEAKTDNNNFKTTTYYSDSLYWMDFDPVFSIVMNKLSMVGFSIRVDRKRNEFKIIWFDENFVNALKEKVNVLTAKAGKSQYPSQTAKTPNSDVSNIDNQSSTFSTSYGNILSPSVKVENEDPRKIALQDKLTKGIELGLSIDIKNSFLTDGLNENCLFIRQNGKTIGFSNTNSVSDLNFVFKIISIQDSSQKDIKSTDTLPFAFCNISLISPEKKGIEINPFDINQYKDSQVAVYIANSSETFYDLKNVNLSDLLFMSKNEKGLLTTSLKITTSNIHNQTTLSPVMIKEDNSWKIIGIYSSSKSNIGNLNNFGRIIWLDQNFISQFKEVASDFEYKLEAYKKEFGSLVTLGSTYPDSIYFDQVATHKDDCSEQTKPLSSKAANALFTNFNGNIIKFTKKAPDSNSELGFLQNVSFNTVPNPEFDATKISLNKVSSLKPFEFTKDQQSFYLFEEAHLNKIKNFDSIRANKDLYYDQEIDYTKIRLKNYVQSYKTLNPVFIKTEQKDKDQFQLVGFYITSLENNKEKEKTGYIYWINSRFINKIKQDLNLY